MEFHRTDGVTVRFTYYCTNGDPWLLSARADDGSWSLAGPALAPRGFAELVEGQRAEPVVPAPPKPELTSEERTRAKAIAVEDPWEFKGTINTLGVEDLDATLARVQAHGGEVVMEKQTIPGVGYQAYFRDVTGIIVGLHQTDPAAGTGA